MIPYITVYSLKIRQALGVKKFIRQERQQSPVLTNIQNESDEFSELMNLWRCFSVEQLDKGKWLCLSYRFQPLFVNITSTRTNGCQKLPILSAAHKNVLINMTGLGRRSLCTTGA